MTECGTQDLRYQRSKHPGDESLLLGARQKGVISQPLEFIPYDVFDIYTTFFITPRKNKEGGRIKDLSLPDYHIKRLSWLNESFFCSHF